ncbi:recombinase family protein [[Clostridium] innocuum]|nr:recombinase family protein [[Clostridium] innocuum]
MNKRAWIHCRVSNYTDRHLLEYQKEVLSKFAEHNNLEVVGITKEISKGVNPPSYELNALRTQIRRKAMDCILIYDKTRLFIHQDLYIDFQILCEQQQILIIDLQNFKIPVVSELMIGL